MLVGVANQSSLSFRDSLSIRELLERLSQEREKAQEKFLGLEKERESFNNFLIDRITSLKNELASTMELYVRGLEAAESHSSLYQRRMFEIERIKERLDLRLNEDIQCNALPDEDDAMSTHVYRSVLVSPSLLSLVTPTNSFANALEYILDDRIEGPDYDEKHSFLQQQVLSTFRPDHAVLEENTRLRDELARRNEEVARLEKMIQSLPIHQISPTFSG